MNGPWKTPTSVSLTSAPISTTAWSKRFSCTITPSWCTSQSHRHRIHPFPCKTSTNPAHKSSRNLEGKEMPSLSISQTSSCRFASFLARSKAKKHPRKNQSPSRNAWIPSVTACSSSPRASGKWPFRSRCWNTSNTTSINFQYRRSSTRAFTRSNFYHYKDFSHPARTSSASCICSTASSTPSSSTRTK